MNYMALSETEAVRPYAAGLELLRKTGLRPTHHRLALAKLLFTGEETRHVTAEGLHEEAQEAGVQLSLATVYNTLHQFTDVGLLKKLVIESGRIYFDTNVKPHHHFYHLKTGALQDIDYEEIPLKDLPEPPGDAEISGVHVTIYIDS